MRCVACALGLVVLSSLLSGCQWGSETVIADAEERINRAYVFYLDGSGGDGPVHNWTKDVWRGFLDGGYDGYGESFRWQTGVGVTADQMSSRTYKRHKAAKLAERITTFSRSHPESRITVMGFSAGTVIGVFALEMLPEDVAVENVVLLASSLSADYDLTQAMTRVREKFYVFTSERDTVLRYLVPLVGTADRKAGEVPVGGIRGFVPPSNPTPQTCEQYEKLVHIRWGREFSEHGHAGDHVDAVNPTFVKELVVPLICERFTEMGTSSPWYTELVANPDFDRWLAFSPGSWFRVLGSQSADGKREDVQITEKLVMKSEERLYIERTFEFAMRDGVPACVINRGFFEWRQIRGIDHPLTHPSAETVALDDMSYTIQGLSLRCEGMTIKANADFADWGDNTRMSVFYSDQIPGGLVKIDISAGVDGKADTFGGRLVAFHVE
ncbi:MAG: T6SS effector phospholipase Tle3 domain-containing protein [Phycisphaerae bacterium]